MKYVPGASEVRALMKKHRLKRFDPYRFDTAAVRDMVELLHRGRDHRLEIASPEVEAMLRRQRLWMTVAVAIGAVIILLASIAFLR